MNDRRISRSGARRRPGFPVAALALVLAPLAGCVGGLLQSEQADPLAYELRATPAPALSPTIPEGLTVLRPLARPGLDGDRIAVWLPDRRLDAYAGARWSAPAPDMVQSLLLDGFRERGGWQRVLPDRSQVRGRYWLQTELRDFQAEYADAGGPPVVRVTLRGDLGRAGDRSVIGSVEARAEVRAAADRLGAVTAAFEAAFGEAAAELGTRIHALALAAESSSTEAAGAR